MPGVSLEESDKIGAKVEQILLSIPEIQTVGRKTGRAELDEHALGVNTSEIEAPFILDKRSKNELLSDIREKLGLIPGITSKSVLRLPTELTLCSPEPVPTSQSNSSEPT